MKYDMLKKMISFCDELLQSAPLSISRAAAVRLLGLMSTAWVLINAFTLIHWAGNLQPWTKWVSELKYICPIITCITVCRIVSILIHSILLSKNVCRFRGKQNSVKLSCFLCFCNHYNIRLWTKRGYEFRSPLQVQRLKLSYLCIEKYSCNLVHSNST